MAEHTPTPWGRGKTGPDQIMILGDKGSGNYVCHIQIAQCGGGAIARAMEPERKANAEFIMRAVNSHDDLLAALNGLLEMSSACTTDVEVIENVRRREVARAAIAKAEGKQP